MKIEVEILARDQSFRLKDEGEPVVVPAGDVLIVVKGAEETAVRLDGRLRSFQPIGGARLLAVDLTRSTGFHHLHIPPGFHFWFGTEDAKLGLEGVAKMLGYLRTECKAWTGQLLFTDGTYLRDAHVIYGWLDEHADRILAAADAIVTRPVRRSSHRRIVTTHAEATISVPRTMALIRQNPREHLEEGPGGPLHFEGRSFYPRKVTALKRVGSLDTPANRRTVWLLGQLITLVDEVLAAVNTGEETARCTAWRTRLGRLLTLSGLAALVPEATRRFEGGTRSVEETMRPDYRDTYEGAQRVANLTGWSATRIRRPAFSYTDFSDSIYQAFVVSMIAHTLQLQPTTAALGIRQPAFEGNGWAIYFNVTPPPHILRSWRSFTPAPDRYRPDILIHDKQSGRVLLADAKYRDDQGDSPESGRKELEAYMAAFGLNKVLMVYPPASSSALSVRYIEWEDRKLAEMAIGPRANLEGWLAANMPTLLENLLTEPHWRD